jgi:3-oxosteroid 1-dehydrogenase
LILRTLVAKLTGRHWVTAGAALQGRMLQAALKAGIHIRTNSPVQELIVENGTVVGVVTMRDGHECRVRARLGVLLNAGGFSHNQTMRDRYMPHTSSQWSLAAAGDTGDMHREAMRIGAAVAQMNEMVGNQMTLPPGGTEPSAIQMQLSKPHAFLVDQSGQRYMNECGSYMEFCQRVIARHEQTGKGIPSWMIVDSRYLRTYMLASSMPGTKKPQAWLEKGYLRRGETIEQLAQACDIDQARLKATTERFNDFARKGRDEDFQRGDRAATAPTIVGLVTTRMAQIRRWVRSRKVPSTQCPSFRVTWAPTVASSRTSTHACSGRMVRSFLVCMPPVPLPPR